MKKIAFMFLIKKKIMNEDIWENFFSNVSSNKYNIYIHYKNNVKLQYFEKYKLLKCIDTQWGHRSLVDAQNLLIKESLKDIDNTHFILLSENCIPVKNFDFIYNFLDINYSYFDIKNPDIKQLNKEIYKFLNKEEIKKSTQWCILNRKHAEFLYNKEFIIKFFEGNNYPDERVYITALYKFNMEREIINFSTTYCKWIYKSPHPIDYTMIQSKFIYFLLQSPYLFARKFNNCFVKDNRKIYQIGNFQPYITNILSEKNNNYETIEIIKNIGFKDKTENYTNIINKNKGNILHSIQGIIEKEQDNYKKIYSFKDY